MFSKGDYMKAAVLVADKTIVIKDVPILEPKENECTVKIKYAGVCSSDIFRGYGNGAYGYPLIMGHELAGEIVSIGYNVKGIIIGDKVTIFPLKPCFSCISCNKKNICNV